LHRRWPARGEHVPSSDEGARTKRMSEPELARVVDDLAVLARREFDCWVESCWCVASARARAWKMCDARCGG
jgi:hypothetical protein